MKNTIETFLNKINKTNSGCWIWQGSACGDGYGFFQINGKRYKPHRYSFEHYNGPIPKGMFVCHKCDIPLCVNPAHLWLGTLQDNHNDMMIKGRHGYGKQLGKNNPSAKLTEQQVLEIRSLPGPNWKLAIQYNVSKNTIDCIKNRKSWTHL